MTANATETQKAIFTAIAGLTGHTFTPSEISRQARTTTGEVEDAISELGDIIGKGAMGDTEQHYFVRNQTALQAHVGNLA